MTTARWISAATLECPGIVRTIRLEPLAPAHAPDLFAAADQDLFRHSLQAPADWSPRGFEADIRWITSLPDVIALAMVLVETGRAVGRTTFMDIRPDHRAVEIGRTWIARAHHGTRVNPEAKYLMLRHAFESLAPAAVRVQLTTNITNVHSQAAIAKLGAVREGVLRKARILPASATRPEPVTRDWVYYSILDEEWPAAKAALEARLR